ncbi:CASP-like protein 2C1 [Ananas comosus]|nr:CASP-like protein 2C1 [Ananas comosus]
MAALQGSLIAVTGVGSFQWSKVCNIYTRFCVQVGGSLICGIAASLAMAVVSSLSAYRLFRLYPSVARSASPRRWRCWALL